jgi:hypothetical protein
MATGKQEQRGISSQVKAADSAPEEDRKLEPADFELDDLLRSLRLDQWFAMAEEGMPLWVC